MIRNKNKRILKPVVLKCQISEETGDLKQHFRPLGHITKDHLTFKTRYYNMQGKKKS